MSLLIRPLVVVSNCVGRSPGLIGATFLANPIPFISNSPMEVPQNEEIAFHVQVPRRCMTFRRRVFGSVNDPG